MARDPGSTWRPLPESTDGSHGNHAKTQLIFHSTGTTASAAANARYFARGDIGVESHFIVGYGPSDPTLQVMDTRARADANTTASRRAISIETVGTGGEPFTAWQVAELVRIGRWARDTHDIPARQCRAHDDPGFGWHVMFGAPGPWTTVRGKVCPGAARVQQIRTIILPAIFAENDEEIDVTTIAQIMQKLDDVEEVGRQANRGLNTVNRNVQAVARSVARVAAASNLDGDQLDEIQATLAEVEANVIDIAAKVGR